MFGTLFEDDEEGSPQVAGSVTVFGPSNRPRPDGPPPPRLSCGLCGIDNQGATCYLNSLIQTLLFTPEFRESLFALGPDELGRLEDKDKAESKVRVIPVHLQKLFARLLLLNQQSASTTELTDSFGWTNNEELQQHDVQELNRILFSAIEDSLVGTNGQNLISRLYHGSIVNQIQCDECHRISEREEDFLDLTVTVAGNTGLENGLFNSYVEVEKMDGSNQYRCEGCNKLVNASKGAKIRKLPPILTVSLLRFSFDYVRMERYKELGKFTFPQEIDMSIFCENTAPSEDTQYELFSVLIHRGSTHGGHYHVHLRDVDGLGKWTQPEETGIRVATKKAGPVDYLEVKDPTELLETIISNNGGGGMTVDKMCGELTKQTGITWNKRFKKRYGTINKFLKKWDDKFVFVPETNWVSLKQQQGGASGQKMDSPQEHAPANGHSPGVSCDQSGLDGGTSGDVSVSVGAESGEHENQSSGGEDQKCNQRSESFQPEPAYCWFDFDDSRVQPIVLADLEKQFSGRESAYMLFYRRRNMTRPSSAFGDPSYAVPEWLLKEVIKENDELDKNREEYDREVNRVTLEVHFGHMYDYRDGALQPIVDGESSAQLTLDRRKTIEDLKTAIKELGGQVVPIDLTLHTAKVLPAGLHLYECVSEFNDPTLADRGIADGDQIFVWDGKQVHSETPAIGEKCEPLYLTITYGNPSKICQGFPKNMALGQLRCVMSEYSGIEFDHLQLNVLVNKGEETLPVTLTADNNERSLADLQIEDGASLIAENIAKKGRKLSDHVAAKQVISVVVENRCGSGPAADHSWPVEPVKIQKDASVAELKKVILDQLGLKELISESRLRIYDDITGVMPPLLEGQSLSAASIKQGMQVILEHGEAPTKNQICLSCSSPSTADSELLDFEMIVAKSLTVSQLTGTIMEIAELKGDEWHLRKTNWCGEAAGVLDDPSMTLEQAEVKNGDHLLVEEGKLPPKGYLSLSVWLYSTPEQANSPSGPGGMISWITNGIQGMFGADSSEAASSEPILLGEVQISKEATLDDLKGQIMTLPLMLEVSVPMPQFLRLRMLENGRPTLVLKGSSEKLQRLKLGGSSSQICAQVLQQEETLSPNHTLLSVQQRIPETRLYTPPQELTWDTSKGVGPQNLRQAVADMLILPVERVVIAKHCLERFEWTVIKDVQPNRQKNRGKRKGKNSVNIRQSPYFIKDGDIIGVKDLQFDPTNQDDFSTGEDAIGKENQRMEAEAKKNRRTARRNAEVDLSVGGVEVTVPQRKPEVGLTIKVDKFT